MDGHGRLAYSTLALTSALTVTPPSPPSIKKLQGKLEFPLQAAIYCLFVVIDLINKTNNTLDKSSRWKRLWKIKTIPTLEFLILPRNSLLNLSLNPDPLFFPPSHLRNWRGEEAGIPGAACVCDQDDWCQRAAALCGHGLPCTTHQLDVWRQAAGREVRVGQLCDLLFDAFIYPDRKSRDC